MNPSIDLEAAQAAFFASGGQIIVLEGFQYVPHRPHRDIEKVQAVTPKPECPKKKRRLEQLSYLRGLAKTMTYSQARAHTGMSQSALYQASRDGGFSFQVEPRSERAPTTRTYTDPAVDRALAQQIAALRDEGLNRSQAKARLGISDRKFCRLIHLFSVDYPKAEGKRCDGPI